MGVAKGILTTDGAREYTDITSELFDECSVDVADSLQIFWPPSLNVFHEHRSGGGGAISTSWCVLDASIDLSAYPSHFHDDRSTPSVLRIRSSSMESSELSPLWLFS